LSTILFLSFCNVINCGSCFSSVLNWSTKSASDGSGFQLAPSHSYRKLYVICGKTPFLMILNDLEGHFSYLKTFWIQYFIKWLTKFYVITCHISTYTSINNCRQLTNYYSQTFGALVVTLRTCYGALQIVVLLLFIITTTTATSTTTITTGRFETISVMQTVIWKKNCILHKCVVQFISDGWVSCNHHHHFGFC